MHDGTSYKLNALSLDCIFKTLVKMVNQPNDLGNIVNHPLKCHYRSKSWNVCCGIISIQKQYDKTKSDARWILTPNMLKTKFHVTFYLVPLLDFYIKCVFEGQINTEITFTGLSIT